MAGESYSQHSEGDNVESRALCPGSDDSCLPSLLSMLGHPNFKITHPIEGERRESSGDQDRIRVPSAEAAPRGGRHLFGRGGETVEGEDEQVEGQQVQHS